MRFRITVRGNGIELRGFMDELTDENAPTLVQFSEAMKPIGLVIASPMEGAPDEGQPDPVKSQSIIVQKITETSSIEEAVQSLAMLHYGQAMVIRGERDEKDQLQRDMHERELHHFEVEQENERLKADHTESEKALIDQVNTQADTIERLSEELREAQRVIQTMQTVREGL